MKKSLIALALVSLTAPAVANTPGITLGNVASRYKEVKADYGKILSWGIIAKGCAEAVAELRSSGAKTARSTEASLADFGAVKVDDYYYEITAEQASRLCSEAAALDQVLADYKVFSRTIGVGRYLTLEMMPSDSYVAGALEMADECDKAVDRLLAANIPTTFPYEMTTHQDVVVAKTVGDLKSGVCNALRVAAKQFTKAAEAALEKVRAEYRKYGMAADKLDLMVTDGGNFYLPGGSAPSDLRKYAKASAWFMVLTTDPDAANDVVHTVRKFHFKGNKLLKTTEKQYRRPKGVDVPRAAFK